MHLPNYSLEVIEACSGLRSLVTLLALGSLHAWLSMTGRVRSVVLVLATIPIVMLANVFRIFVTAMGTYSISKELAESFLHEISGLLVFVSAIVMMITGVVLKWTQEILPDRSCDHCCGGRQLGCQVLSTDAERLSRLVHEKLSDEVRNQLLSISAATIERISRISI